MFLIDTNVISETRKGLRANAGVALFFREHQSSELYLCAQIVGEIRRGIENLRWRGELGQAARLGAWLDVLIAQYRDRILDFDLECAQVWGRLMSPQGSHRVDKQIAAIALMYDLRVVTRNGRDFASSGVKVLNPFS